MPERRRPKGQGQIDEVAPDVFRSLLRWRGRDGRSHDRAVRTRSRPAAWEALAGLQRLRDAGTLDGPRTDRLTLKGWLDGWLPRHAQRARLRPPTVAGYAQAFAYVLPRLGGIRLAALRRGHLQEVIDGLAARGLAPGTVRFVHAKVRAALRAAVAEEVIPRSPAEGVQLPAGADREERVPPALADVARLLALADAAGDRYAPLWRLAAFTGLRVGEARRLTWGDLTLPAAPGAAGAVRVREAKTRAGRRSIPLAPEVVAALRALPRGVAGAPVFVAPRGGQLHEATVSDHLKRALARAGLDRSLPWHRVFRHGAITAMLHATNDLDAVAAGAGHSEKAALAVTLGVYSHASPERVRAAYQALREALTGPVGATLEGNAPSVGVAHQEGTG